MSGSTTHLVGNLSLFTFLFSMSRQSLVKPPIYKPESELQVGVQASEKVAGVLFGHALDTATAAALPSQVSAQTLMRSGPMVRLS